MDPGIDSGRSDADRLACTGVRLEVRALEFDRCPSLGEVVNNGFKRNPSSASNTNVDCTVFQYPPLAKTTVSAERAVAVDTDGVEREQRHGLTLAHALRNRGGYRDNEAQKDYCRTPGVADKEKEEAQLGVEQHCLTGMVVHSGMDEANWGGVRAAIGEEGLHRHGSVAMLEILTHPEVAALVGPRVAWKNPFDVRRKLAPFILNVAGS